MNTALITSYVNPDLDGIACVIAYAELLHTQGTPAVAGYFGEPSPEAKYVMDRFEIPYPQRLNSADGFEKVIALDVSKPGDLEGKVPLNNVTEIVDHRKVHEAEKFPNAKVQIELVGSAATLVAEKFRGAGIIPSKNASILLLSAIISNTLNFQANVTTDRDRAVYEWLLPIANLPSSYARELFLAKSDMTGDRLQKAIAGDLALFDFGQYHAGIAQIEMIGGFELVEQRKEEILSVLAGLKQKHSLDWIYLSIAELEKACTIFVATDEIPQKVLSELFNVEFHDSVAVHQGLVMRKEIAALLKGYFSNKE